ncbi:MAG: hypothetical protein RL329_1856 [Bacteroidota bacterium]
MENRDFLANDEDIGMELIENQAFYDRIAAKIQEEGIDVAAIQAIKWA